LDELFVPEFPESIKEMTRPCGFFALMLRIRHIGYLFFLLLLVPYPSLGQEYSDLWGKFGENWDAKSRLPDFSYAGYHSGELEISTLPIVANVKDFGAVGNGINDDTKAFINAIAKSCQGAIYIPPGRYKITKILEINKSNIVLRGAGPEKSVLFFPSPLNDVKPNWVSVTGKHHISNYSWSGGMIWVKGDFNSEPLTYITSQAMRGDTQLEVSSTEKLKVNERIEIFIEDDNQKTLTNYLYAGTPGNIKSFPGSTGSFVVTLKKILNNKIFFDRPLRFDVKLNWNPQIRRFAPTVSEVGIEDLSLEFPASDYEGHFSERGYNGIALTTISDSWVRNIKILHADSGIFTNSKFCTISDVKFESNRASNKGVTGHHGIILGGTDNHFTGFRFNTSFIHDLAVSKNHAGNVFSNGSGVDLNFDHHRRAPYENLFTNISLGKGTRMWQSGGGKNLGKHCGTRGTFWNIKSLQSQHYPGKEFGPNTLNMVAIQSNSSSTKNVSGIWFEAIEPHEIMPQNLHSSQLARRLNDQEKMVPKDCVH